MTKGSNTLTDIDPFLDIKNLNDDIEYFKKRVDTLAWISENMQNYTFDMKGNNERLCEMNSLFMAIIQSDLNRAVDLVNANRKERFTT